MGAADLNFDERMDKMNRVERSNLVAQHADAPAHPVGVVLACCAGIVALTVLVAAGGAWTTDRKAQASTQASYRGEATARAGSTEEHRRDLFDERRARFTSSASDQVAVAVPGEDTRRPARALPAAAASFATSLSKICSGGPDGGMDATGNQCSE